MVVTAGDTIRLYDTIHVIVPVPYNFGPDIYLCEKGDTSLTAPLSRVPFINGTTTV